jgi:hypothetical protein
MPLDQAEYSQLILLDVGDTSTRAIESAMLLLWKKHDDIADLDLRALFVKRDAIGIALADVRKQVTVRGLDGASVDLNKLFEHLQQMRTNVEAQIASAGAAASGGVEIGTLTTTAPLMPSGRELDANERRYRGDPLRRW